MGRVELAEQSSTALTGIPNENRFTQQPRMPLPDTSSQEAACIANIYKFWYEDGNSEKQSPWMTPSLILVSSTKFIIFNTLVCLAN